MEHILNHEKAHQKYFEEMTAIPHGIQCVSGGVCKGTRTEMDTG